MCESVLEDMFSDSDSAIENTPEEMLEDEESELQEEKVEELELEPRKRKVSANVQKLIDFGYKGIQAYYDYNGETYFQAKDIMCWIQNREYHEGVRNNILFFMNYIWFVYNSIWTYVAMFERSKKLNTYFKPSLSEAELSKAVRYNFNNLNSRNHYNLSIKNTVIQSYLHFTEEEKQQCCIGLYCDTYEEYQRAVALRKKRLSRERYTKQLEKDGLVRKSERKEQYKKLLEDNPLMTVKEFIERTGLSKASYDVYKRELGNSRAKHFQEQRDYYLQPFKSSEIITFNWLIYEAEAEIYRGITQLFLCKQIADDFVGIGPIAIRGR